MNNRINESNLVNLSGDLSTLSQLDTKESLALSFPFDHIYACHSEDSERQDLDKEIEISALPDDKDTGAAGEPFEVHKLSERLSAAEVQNTRLKHLLVYHLDLIQQQNEIICKKDKQNTALKLENDSLKSKVTRMDRRITVSQRHNVNPAPALNLPPPTPSTSTKNEASTSDSQMVLNSLTEFLVPDNRANPFLFNNELAKATKPLTPDPFDLARTPDTDVSTYLPGDIGVPSILETGSLQSDNFNTMIENKRSYLKKETKPEPRSEPLYTVTSNSGNTVIQKIQRTRRRTSGGLGSLSRLPKTAPAKPDPPETANIFEDDRTFSVNKKSKMINTYGKSKTSTIPKKTPIYTGSLSDRLQLIDTTPTGEDPYQLGEADMREQSPIPKLMLQKSNHGRMKICSDLMGDSTLPSRRIYDAPATETSTKMPNKIKLEKRYNLPNMTPYTATQTTHTLTHASTTATDACTHISTYTHVPKPTAGTSKQAATTPKTAATLTPKQTTRTPKHTSTVTSTNACTHMSTYTHTTRNTTARTASASQKSSQKEKATKSPQSGSRKSNAASKKAAQKTPFTAPLTAPLAAPLTTPLTTPLTSPLTSQLTSFSVPHTSHLSLSAAFTSPLTGQLAAFTSPHTGQLATFTTHTGQLATFTAHTGHLAFATPIAFTGPHTNQLATLTPLRTVPMAAPPDTDTLDGLAAALATAPRGPVSHTITEIKTESPPPPSPTNLFMQHPDMDRVKKEPDLEWPFTYSSMHPAGSETSLCDFSYGENSNLTTLPGLDVTDFRQLIESDAAAAAAVTALENIDSLDYSAVEKIETENTKKRGARTTSMIEPGEEQTPDNQRGMGSKRGRKRALSSASIAKQNLSKTVGPKPKMVRGKAASRGKKSPLPGMTTNQPYHTLVGDPDLSWYLGLDPDVKLEDVDQGDCKASTVEVPRWREKPVTSLYSLEGTENLDDKVFEKRHQKLEAEERRQLRWHMRRIREQRHVERLKMRQRDPWYNHSHYQPSVYTIWPQPQRDVRMIEITDTLPVMAFGEDLPNIPPADFMLPWVRISKPLKRSKRSKTLH